MPEDSNLLLYGAAGLVGAEALGVTNVLGGSGGGGGSPSIIPIPTGDGETPIRGGLGGANTELVTALTGIQQDVTGLSSALGERSDAIMGLRQEFQEFREQTEEWQEEAEETATGGGLLTGGGFGGLIPELPWDQAGFDFGSSGGFDFGFGGDGNGGGGDLTPDMGSERTGGYALHKDPTMPAWVRGPTALGAEAGSAASDVQGFAEENPIFSSVATGAAALNAIPVAGNVGYGAALATGAGAEILTDTVTGGTPLGVESPIDLTGGPAWQGPDFAAPFRTGGGGNLLPQGGIPGKGKLLEGPLLGGGGGNGGGGGGGGDATNTQGRVTERRGNVEQAQQTQQQQAGQGGERSRLPEEVKQRYGAAVRGL